MSTPLTLSQASSKARNWCARQERSHNDVRSKLYHWGLKTNEVEQLIAGLIAQGFISEERFAKQYAGGKFRIKKWGRLKIMNHLKQKNISQYCISKGLSEIPDKDYLSTLRNLLEKKAKTINEKNPLLKKNKIARYLLNKGYEPDLVWEEIGSF